MKYREISPEELKEILEKHDAWWNDSEDGERADLSEANLSYANLSDANLSDANLSDANLSDANLRAANLRAANLRAADLSYADLSEANLSEANLSDANLSDADLSYANLSMTDGLVNPTKWMLDNFEQDESGIIVYKATGNTHYEAPQDWKFEPGEFLQEVVNFLPTVSCGCGVNFATLGWIENNFRSSVIWKCRINWVDLANVCVPYNTDGKARCGRLELLEIVEDTNDVA